MKSSAAHYQTHNQTANSNSITELMYSSAKLEDLKNKSFDRLDLTLIDLSVTKRGPEKIEGDANCSLP